MSVSFGNGSSRNVHRFFRSSMFVKLRLFSQQIVSIIAAVVAYVGVCAHASGNGGATEILDQYALTQSALSRCDVVYQITFLASLAGGNDLQIDAKARSHYLCDGACASDIFAERETREGDLSDVEAPSAANLHSLFIYSHIVATAQDVTTYTIFPQDRTQDEVNINRTILNHLQRLQPYTLDINSAWLQGWDTSCSDRLDDVLRTAKNVQVGDDVIEGHPCRILKATTPTGKYSIWFDVSRGANILRAHIERDAFDLVRDKPLWLGARDRAHLPFANVPFSDADRNVREITDLGDVQLKLFGSTWLPIRAVVKVTEIDRSKNSRPIEIQVECPHVDLSPKFDSEAFVLKIPNGTRVWIQNGEFMEPIPRRWRDGKAVIDIDQMKLDLLDKSIRELSTTGSASRPSITGPTSTAGEPAAPTIATPSLPEAQEWIWGALALLALIFCVSLWIFYRRSRSGPGR